MNAAIFRFFFYYST
ncbi:pheST operon leader peptide PheM [Shigella boydii]|nr:pheST operon leader peptide PheM [Shigella boydii]